MSLFELGKIKVEQKVTFYIYYKTMSISDASSEISDYFAAYSTYTNGVGNFDPVEGDYADLANMISDYKAVRDALIAKLTLLALADPDWILRRIDEDATRLLS